MNILDSLELRLERLLATVVARTLRVFVPLRQYLDNTRVYFVWFFVVYAVGLLLPPFIPFYGNMVAFVAVMICGFLWMVAKVRLAAVGIGIDVGEGFVPGPIRRNISLVNPPTAPHVEVEEAEKLGREIKFYDNSVTGRVFRGLATAGLWIMAPLLVGMSFPVWNNPSAYFAAIGCMVFLMYTVAADWTISGWATRALRWSVIYLLVYNLLRIVFPGYEYLLLVSAALMLYAVSARDKVPDGAKKLADIGAVAVLVFVLLATFLPGLTNRVTTAVKEWDNNMAVASQQESRDEAAAAEPSESSDSDDPSPPTDPDTANVVDQASASVDKWLPELTLAQMLGILLLAVLLIYVLSSVGKAGSIGTGFFALVAGLAVFALLTVATVKFLIPWMDSFSTVRGEYVEALDSAALSDARSNIRNFKAAHSNGFNAQQAAEMVRMRQAGQRNYRFELATLGRTDILTDEFAKAILDGKAFGEFAVPSNKIIRAAPSSWVRSGKVACGSTITLKAWGTVTTSQTNRHLNREVGPLGWPYIPEAVTSKNLLDPAAPFMALLVRFGLNGQNHWDWQPMGGEGNEGKYLLTISNPSGACQDIFMATNDILSNQAGQWYANRWRENSGDFQVDLVLQSLGGEEMRETTLPR